MKTTLLRALASAACLWFAASTAAHDFKKGDLHIEHPYATATVQGQSVGGVFFKHIANTGNKADTLIAASIDPSIATSTELHVMSTENDIMRMREVNSITIPAKATVPMTRGLKKDGYHVMLMGLKKQLKVGDKLPLKLKFEQAGEIEVIINVEALKAGNAAEVHKH
jgi:copper(I)-binding protein